MHEIYAMNIYATVAHTFNLAINLLPNIHSLISCKTELTMDLLKREKKLNKKNQGNLILKTWMQFKDLFHSKFKDYLF